MPIKVMAKADRKAEITIYGPIGAGFFDEGLTAETVRNQLNEVGEVDTIDVFINSPGGNFWDSLAIGNMLKEHPATVHAHVESLAASGASIIMASADKVTMSLGAQIMIHSASSLVAGNAEELRSLADVLDEVDNSQVDVFEERTGKPRAELLGLLKAETWFNAEAAIEAGLADEKAESKPKAKSKVSASWQPIMACFKNTPKSFITPQVTVGSPQSAPAGAATEETEMPEKATASVQTTDNTAAVNAAAEKGRVEERQRVAEITAKCDQFGMDATFTQAAITQGLSVEAVNAQILDVKFKSTQGGTIPHAEITEDEHDKLRANATAWLVARAGRGKVEADNPFRGMTIENIAREVLEANGVRTRAMSREVIIKAALTHSTGDFPNIFENALHKTMLNSFELAKPAWPRFCRTTTLSDFRPHLRYRMGSFSDLLPILENGEYKDGTIPDAERESIRATSKGRILNITREMLVNDDMNVFSGAASALGQAAARTLDKDVFNLFASNGPTMGDGHALFDNTNHKNVISSGTAPTIAAFEAMRVKMAEQKDPSNNDYLDIRPTIWLGPLSLGGQARSTNAAEYDDEATKNQKRPNISRGLFSDIVDTPRLPATIWYALADPAVEPVFEVGFVNGVQVPQLEMEEAFRSNGMSWRVSYDYGVGAVGFRGIVRNAGTGG